MTPKPKRKTQAPAAPRKPAAGPAAKPPGAALVPQNLPEPERIEHENDLA